MYTYVITVFYENKDICFVFLLFWLTEYYLNIPT